jgi:hypothetical protein
MEPTAKDWDDARETVRRKNKKILAPHSATGHWRVHQPGDDVSGARHFAATLRHSGFENGYLTYEVDQRYVWVEGSDGECV